MLRLPFKKLVKALAVNQVKRFDVTRRIQDKLGGRARGGEDWSSRALSAHVAHVLDIFDGILPCIGDVIGKVGVEIGPGDDIAVAYCFLKAGAKKMYTVERFDSVRLDARMKQLFEKIDEQRPQLSHVKASDVLSARGSSFELDTSRLEHRVGNIEQENFPEALDFAYSNDVMEHVADPGAVFVAAHRLLRSGGQFVNNVDLSGHNAFSNPRRPLDFLTCPDWVWPLLSSNIVTTNRVRYSDLLRDAHRAGFAIEKTDVLVSADPKYLKEIRSDLLPRYRALSDEDLSVVQVRLTARRVEWVDASERPAARAELQDRTQP